MTGFPSNVNETKVLWGGDRYISAKKREDNTFQKEDNRRQREDNNRLRKTIIFKGRQQSVSRNERFSQPYRGCSSNWIVVLL